MPKKTAEKYLTRRQLRARLARRGFRTWENSDGLETFYDTPARRVYKTFEPVETFRASDLDAWLGKTAAH